MPLIHGSQGCATYIRRYAISHYREPIDIASSSFDEQAAVFGGGKNLRTAIKNIVKQYNPGLIGIVTNCLSETIGDDVALMLRDFSPEDAVPPVAIASAPSYKGGWEDGYFSAVSAAIEALARPQPAYLNDRVAVLAPLASPADIRELRRIGNHFGLNPIIAPDISDALDGGDWDDYKRLPPGGTPLSDVAVLGSVRAVIDVGGGCGPSPAAVSLQKSFGRQVIRRGLPMGIEATDALCDVFSELSGKPMPDELSSERSRLVDAYFDGHKYIAGKRAAIVGDTDLCAALALWCREVGITPGLIATNGALEDMKELFGSSGVPAQTRLLGDTDYDVIASEAKSLSIDICFGSGKARGMAAELDAPLVRIGFPIHDRFGAGRLLTLGYRGGAALFDMVVNALIERKQSGISGGYSYL
jgi:nitrogenase molybdenum-iron protein NifN